MRYLHTHLRERFPRVDYVTKSRSVAELYAAADFLTLDVPATSLCEVFELPIHIATVELMADFYPDDQIMLPQTLNLLRKRCLVAKSFAEFPNLVDRCLRCPETITWPDPGNREYFDRFVRNPDDQTGFEAYETALRTANGSRVEG